MFQETSLDFKLVQRICLLQQALDQAMDSLDDLQKRVADHQMLESQLAQTEEFSNVQQKIIVNLQQQLAAKTQWQHEVLAQLLVGVRRLINDQQLELERLRARVQQSQTEVQDYLVRLKNNYQQLPLYHQAESDIELTTEVMVVRALIVSLSSQLQAAQQHIRQLDRTLTRHQVSFAQMQAQVKTINAMADEPAIAADDGIAPERSYPEDHFNGNGLDAHGDYASGVAPDQRDLLATADDPVALRVMMESQQRKISELSGELQQQLQQQTRIKYRCQELAAERDGLKQREAELSLENELLKQRLHQQAAPQPSDDGQAVDWLPRTQSARALFRFKADE
jgi:chromosome segregation ATPase